MGWEWGSLYSSAQRPSLALWLEDSAWAHRNLGLGFRKPLPPRSLESLAKPCPSPVPFGATCWGNMAYFHLLTIPALGATLALVSRP